MFLQGLSRFAKAPARYDLDAALTDLTENVTAILGLCGSGITMANDGLLRYVTTATQASAGLERDHAKLHPCPCRDAYTTGEVVRVSGLWKELARWPEFAATAARVSVAGLAAIPMWLDKKVIGTLTLYSTEPRQWSDEALAVARVMADLATSYAVNASKLHQQEQLSEQLQVALDSRIVIEQAKGITAYQSAVTIDQAYQRIRTHARNNNTSLRKVAEAIVGAGLHV